MRYAHAPYDSRVVGNTFIDLAQQENRLLDPMKLQKLVYIAHGWYLVSYKVPLVSETVQAWPRGPVFPELYHEMKRFGKGPITEFYLEFNPETRQFEISYVSEGDETFLNLIWQSYGKYSATNLSRLTHEKGTPWSMIFDGMKRSAIIDNDLIEEHYRKLLEARQRFAA